MLSAEENANIKRSQLQGLVARSQKKNRKGELVVGELRQWCMEHLMPSDPAAIEALDEHTIVVSEFEVTPQKVYVTLTSKKMAATCARAECLQTDATHNTNWHNYPLIVVGHQDKNRHMYASSVHIVWRAECKEVYRKVSDETIRSLSFLDSISVSSTHNYKYILLF